MIANEIADYDGIVVRLRGDGRTYTLNVQTKSIRDDDIHQSFFHTRGGPYWEIVRVRKTMYICCKGISAPKIRLFFLSERYVFAEVTIMFWCNKMDVIF